MVSIAYMETKEGSEFWFVSDPKLSCIQETGLWVKCAKNLWGDDKFFIDSQALVTEIAEVFLLWIYTFKSFPK